jgi:hypothetical protein
MRHFFSSFSRLIAWLLVMTVLTSRIAMAAYVCPVIVQAPIHKMEGMPCAEMDKSKPVHCAEYHAGEKLALEHFAAGPILSPVTVSFVIPVIAPAVPPVLTSFRPDVPLESGSDPPYLRTQRLRI